MPPGILAALRAGTADAHARLEKYVDMPSRAGDSQRYTELLEDFFGWYEPLERAVAAAGDWSATSYAPVERSKVTWLESDLRALGRTPEQIAALPCCSTLPQVDSLASGFGCAYVMEGATLGGRVISGMLAGDIPEEARRFFRSYGELTRDRWLQFIAALEGFAAAQGGNEAVVRAATDSFRTLETWLRHRDDSRSAGET